MMAYPQLTLERNDPQVAAAQEVEDRLFDHYGLVVKTHFVEVREASIRVRVLESGGGSAVLVVPGGVGDGWIWASLMAKLKGWRLIVLNRPGAGMSDGIDHRAVDVRQLAVQTLTSVLDYFNLEHVPVIGNSMGGLWSFWLALDRPERVAGMVQLGCPATILGTSAPFPMRLMSVPRLNRLLVNMMVPNSLEKARDLPTFMGHPKEVGANWPEAMAGCSYQFPRLPTFKGAWLSLMEWVLNLRGTKPGLGLGEEALGRVQQPVLFIWGNRDPFGSLEVAHRAAEAVPNAALHQVGVGHLPWWDDADECAGLIRGFLSKEAQWSVTRPSLHT
jgi:2-hydroxy-6-oxonona-2,4-dienedioate hydrolase